MPRLTPHIIAIAVAGAFALPAGAQTDVGSSALSVSPAQPRAFTDLVTVSMASRSDCVPVTALPATADTTGLPYCVVSWTSAPAGLTQDTSTSSPRLTGKLAAAGTARVAYSLSLVDGTTISPEVMETGAIDIVSALPAPRVELKGPKAVAAGAPVRFSAVVKDQRVPADATTLRGEWLLPDGTVVPGLGLTWTPKEEDFQANRLATLQFRAWVDGHESDTTTSGNAVVSINNVWPRFTLSTRTDGNIAPFKTWLKVGIDPADKDLLGQFGSKNPLRMNWSVPASGIAVKKADKNNAEFTVTAAGTYPIAVEVTDSRGRSTTLETVLEAYAPADFDLEWSIKASNALNRRPVEFKLEPRIAGGHPRDRLNVFEYSVNGAPVVGNGSKARLAFDQAGTYSVTLDARSKLGFAISRTVELTVAPNQLPRCSMTYDYTPVDRGGKRSILVRMNCTDPDGKIKGYAWTADGVLNKSAASNGYRYTYDVTVCTSAGNTTPDPAACPANAILDVVVKDDSGDIAEYRYELPRLYTQCAAQADGRCNTGDTVQQDPTNGTSNPGRKRL